jgi:hypothetical protein
MERNEALKLIWRHTHRDFKGKLADGSKSVLTLRQGGTTLVPIDALTDAEIAEKLPYAQHCEAKRQAAKAVAK